MSHISDCTPLPLQNPTNCGTELSEPFNLSSTWRVSVPSFILHGVVKLRVIQFFEVLLSTEGTYRRFLAWNYATNMQSEA